MKDRLEQLKAVSSVQEMLLFFAVCVCVCGFFLCVQFNLYYRKVGEVKTYLLCLYFSLNT